MKKLVLLLATVCVAFFAFTNVSADTYRAVVIKEGSCSFLVSWDGTDLMTFETNDVMVVASHSKNGNAKFTCKAKKIPEGDFLAGRYDYFNTGEQYLCGYLSPHGQLYTDDWHTTVSKAGNATLTCFFSN